MDDDDLDGDDKPYRLQQEELTATVHRVTVITEHHEVKVLATTKGFVKIFLDDRLVA